MSEKKLLNPSRFFIDEVFTPPGLDKPPTIDTVPPFKDKEHE